MYCTNCGNQLPANATACLGCATSVRRFAPPPLVPNYLVQSILSTLCCCPPFGIVAIIFAAQVNSKLAIGDVPAAMASSRKARTWCWVAFATGVVAALAYGAFMVISLSGLK